MNKQYRLCYVHGNVLYFTDNFKNQWGDDWNDAPYEHNAEEPYEYDKEMSAEDNKYRGHIRCLAYINSNYWLDEARNKGSFSVEEINKGVVPWLYCDKYELYAGETIEGVIEFLKDIGAKWGELHD